MNSNNQNLNEFAKETICKELYRFDDLGERQIKENEVAYEVIIDGGKKSIEFNWKYDPDEVFIFFSLNQKVIFEDWVDSLDRERVSDFVDYLVTIANRYLNHKTQIVVKGWWVWKHHQMQVLVDGEWISILSR